MLDSGAALHKAPVEPDRDASNSGSDSQEGRHICLSYDSPVCPALSSRWQGISGDSRFSHKTQPCSAGSPDAMDPERGIVGFGALRWWERCFWKSIGTVIRYLVLSQSCAALVLTMADS